MSATQVKSWLLLLHTLFIHTSTIKCKFCKRRDEKLYLWYQMFEMSLKRTNVFIITFVISLANTDESGVQIIYRKEYEIHSYLKM